MMGARQLWRVASIAVWAASLGGCQSAEPSIDSVQQAISAQPSIATFALFAERSIKIGAHDDADGAIGIAIATRPGSGVQVTLGDHSNVADVYAPSLRVGPHSRARDVATDA